MPKFAEEITVRDEYKGACGGVKVDLKDCLLDTECVKLHQRTPRDCLQSRDPSVPQQCYQLATLYYDCRRSIIDMRSRFRGRKGY